MEYHIGFDVGSDSVHAVVLDSENNVVFSPQTRAHFGNPTEVLKEVYEDILEKFDEIKSISFTGSVGEFIAEKTKTPFFHDTITIPLGASIIAPEAEYIFHVGAKDPYFFEKESFEEKSFVPDHGTGTKCGGGSGILITKQCRRFFEYEFPIEITEGVKENRKIMQEQLNNIFERAEKEISKSKKDIDVGGRCGVVVQSDMIHLQNSGEIVSDILKGMFARIAKNYKSDVIRTRNLDKNKKAIATGGIFANNSIKHMFEEEIGVKINVPEEFQKIGAIGAAVKGKDKEGKLDINKIAELSNAEKEKVKTAKPLSSGLNKVKIYDEEKGTKKEDLIIYESKFGDVVIGLDGGSTTTKAIIADAKTLKIIAEICIYTNGRPLQAAQEIFRQIKKYLGDITIKGIAYTGSSGAFYHKLFTDNKKEPEKKCIDIVKDEITCHAYGVKHFNNKVDTIFELGGQDAKFTLFNKDGTVKKSKMNLSCMAGTGQTMQNMVEMIGLDIKDSFNEYALKAKQTPVVDETCGVFTEAGIAKLIAMGFPKEEIAAAIAYGFMGGYINKFVGNEKFGDYASAQGGPFRGKACLAALALHTGMEIHAFPHRQLFGALGAAIAVKREIEQHNGVSKFRGLGIADIKFDKETKNCSDIVKNTCKLRDCKLQVYEVGNDIISSGGLCPKGNTETFVKKAPNYIENYRKILDKHLGLFTTKIDDNTEKERILIPRSLTFLNEKGVFYTALYNALGFNICISPESNDDIANKGINYAHSEMCYPVKLAHGHGAFLKEFFRKGKDKILLVNAIGTEKEKYKFCPYVAGAGFLVKDALGIENSDALLPVLFFNDSDYKIEEFVLEDLNRVFSNRFSLEQIKESITKAKKAEEEFLKEIYSTGEKIVNALKEKGEKIFIGIGRGYTVLDDKASSKVHELFASYGMHFVPAIFLKTPDIDIEKIADNMYWYQGRNMIKYNLMCSIEPNLYAVRETNFNCGTDSFILYHEEDIMTKADKPHLVLQTDGHNSNAQFGTRTLANHEVVKKHSPRDVKTEEFIKNIPEPELKTRIVGIPYMGDDSYALAAAFKAIGINAEVMPTQTKESQELARKFVSTNTCRPFSFQIGDNLAWLYSLKDKGIDVNKKAAVFETKAKGPCRFGQYSVMLRKFFDENGFNEVPVVSPDAEKDYTDFPLSKLEIIKFSNLAYKGLFCNDILFDALLRTRPYEKEKGSADRLYKELSEELYKLIEEKATDDYLAYFMTKAKNKFEELIDKNIKRKPLVIMNGEIFVRCHPLANQDSIKLLEKYGLEVILDMPSQWINYVNKFSIKKYKKTKELKRLVVSFIKKEFFNRTNRKLYTPFANYLKGREQHDPDHIIDEAQKALVFESLIGGESPLSIGEAYIFASGNLHGCCGIYHVGPFGCMHETAATSQIQSLIQKQRKNAKNENEKIIPFMDGVFGDSELPNLEAEIAAFAEKCYLKQEMNEKEKLKK